MFASWLFPPQTAPNTTPKLLAVVLSEGLDQPLLPLSGATTQIFSLVAQHHPTARLLVRWLMTSSDARWFMRLQDVTDPHATVGDPMNSPTRAWATSAAANLSLSLATLDRLYPGRIAGVCIEAMFGGEWFMTAPFSNSSMKADYSDLMQAEFCRNEDAVPNSVDGGVSCTLPTAQQRDTPTLGNALLQWNTPSAPSARSFRFNRFLSRTIAGAIGEITAAIKEVTGGAAFTFAFYGYLLDLSDTRVTGSGHTALGTLLREPSLDAIASPYQYSVAARSPDGAFTVHGPADSAALAGKLWIAEDDSRTDLADLGEWLRETPTDWQTVSLLRRNMLTSLLRGQGVYWLDLESRGWFGRTDNATTVASTSAIWGNASQVLRQWSRLLADSDLRRQVSRPLSVPARSLACIYVDASSIGCKPSVP